MKRKLSIEVGFKFNPPWDGPDQDNEDIIFNDGYLNGVLDIVELQIENALKAKYCENIHFDSLILEDPDE